MVPEDRHMEVKIKLQLPTQQATFLLQLWAGEKKVTLPQILYELYCKEDMIECSRTFVGLL